MRSRTRWSIVIGAVLAATATAGCGNGDDGDGGDDDVTDDAAVIDGATVDGAPVDAADIDARDIDARPIDARPIDAPIDAIPPTSTNHIHIMVANNCAMTVNPTSITVPPNQTAYFQWHNHSVDYPVDVWMSYGGGFLDLPTGQTWNEPIGHCATPLVHDEYGDISTACSSFRFVIHCQ